MKVEYQQNFKISSVESNPSVVKILQEILENACRVKASDIHIDPYEHEINVRFRIDGVLISACVLPKPLLSELVARIKILAGLRTDERYMPQDGRCSFKLDVDIRVSTIPSYYGESVVLRLLKRTKKHLTLSEIGFSNADQEKIQEALRFRHGLILVTGPTGSGKTTTLYTLLNMLAKDSISIVTIEDPIEYAIDNVRQIQVHHKRGFSFATGLRSILRQDPDIIMVGEIRDHETASIAVNAALTGHLVLTTLHTESALSTIARLSEMKIESYLIAATVRMIINQRLIRVLCDSCKTARDLTISEALFLHEKGIDQSHIFSPQGCELCNGTGYNGRSVVAETLLLNDKIKEDIAAKSNQSVLQDHVRNIGMKDLRQHSFSKFSEGMTTIEEIMVLNYE